MTTYITLSLAAVAVILGFWNLIAIKRLRDEIINTRLDIHDVKMNVAETHEGVSELLDESDSKSNVTLSSFNLLLGSAWHELEVSKNMAVSSEQFEAAKNIGAMQESINRVIKHYNEILSK